MIETICWHTLHPGYLGPKSRVLDIGAHYGQFARAITDRLGCKCVAVEPAPLPFASITETPQIKKMQLAVAGRSGTLPFHIASESDASSLLQKHQTHTETISVKTVTLQQLIQELNWPSIDLLKIDVEGAEVEMLDNCPDAVLKRVGQITIEFHDFCGLIPPERVKNTIARLTRLGFVSIRMSGYGHQDTWLINRQILCISTSEILCTRYLLRNLAGLKRVIKRNLSRRPN